MFSKPHHLPLALRTWEKLGRFAAIETQLRISGRLVGQRLAPQSWYRGADGFVLRIDPDDPFQAAMLLGLFGRQATAVMRQHVARSSTVIDAGAHIGYFTLRLAALVGPAGAVHAFEPDPRLYPRLTEHVELNGVPWVTANECGLLDRPQSSHGFALPEQLGWSSVMPTLTEGANTTTVKMTTLDTYVAEHAIDSRTITFIKMDIEGAELDALRGARETLSASSAAVLVEHVPDRARGLGQAPDALPKMMRELGFSPFVSVRRWNGFHLVAGELPTFGQDVLFVKSQGRRAG